MKRVILSDFDDTLADSTEGVRQSVVYAFEQLGLRPPELEPIRQTIGLSQKDTFLRLSKGEAPHLVGPFETVLRLHAQGYQLGVVSTKFRYRIEEILRRDGLLGAFAVIVGGEDVAQKKPDPEGVLKALGVLKADGEDCLYVGDSLIDLETAQRAGVDFVASLTGTTSRLEFSQRGARRFLTELAELVPLMEVGHRTDQTSTSPSSPLR